MHFLCPMSCNTSSLLIMNADPMDGGSASMLLLGKIDSLKGVVKCSY